MDLDTIIIIGLSLIVGGYVGFKASEMLFIITLKDILVDLGITEAQLRAVAEKRGLELGVDTDNASDSDHLTNIEIKLEEHQGQIYAFRIDNDQFLGQGANKDELIARLAERMNNVRLIVNEGSELINQTS